MKKLLIAVLSSSLVLLFAPSAFAGLLNCKVTNGGTKGKITIVNKTNKKVVWAVTTGAPNKGSVAAKSKQVKSVGRSMGVFNFAANYSGAVGACSKTMRKGQTVTLSR